MKVFEKFKRIAMLVLLSNLVLLAYAVSAYPGFIEFRQVSGDVVKIKMKGSETLKWAETEDGYTLVYDAVGNLVYAELDEKGDLVPTDIIATNVSIRPSEVKQRLQATPKRLAYSSTQIDMARRIKQARVAQLNSAEKVPATGTIKMLLILVEFSDYYFKSAQDDFYKLMNQIDYTEGGRYGSVRDYYKENSFNRLDLVTDVVGVYRLKNKRSYYGGNDADSNDSNPRAMASEAVSAANADVNFKDYDNDGDGVVDGVHIIYAGPGEEAGGGSDCIWAHAWTVSATVDGVSTMRYSCSPEIRGSGGNSITHIGVICHEIGHVLGTMDFYDTDYAVDGQYEGTGEWDIMGIGSWNGDGACPAHFNPYSKIYDFGWAEVTQAGDISSFKLSAKTKNSFVRINTRTSGEFFLLEYRAQSGFDTKIPGHGLMIYRATDNLNNKDLNTINTTHKQQFYPIAANATYELPTSDAFSYGNVNSSSTPFPGTLKKDEFTNFTVPSMKSWNGLNTQSPVTSIVENVAEEYATFEVACKFSPASVIPTEGDVEDLSEITLTFTKAVALNSGTRYVTLEGSTDPYHDYAKNVKITLSNDGLEATVTGTPSKSSWSVGETYTLTIPEGYFVDNSTGVVSKAIVYTWTIEGAVVEDFTPEVNPIAGEVTVEEIKTTVITFPSPIASFDGSNVRYAKNFGSVWYDYAAASTIAEDKMSMTINWDFAPEVGLTYTLELPAGCIVLENGAKNLATNVSYLVVAGPKDLAEFTVPAGMAGWLGYDPSDIDAWAPEFPFTVSTSQNNTISFAATLPSLPTGVTAMEVVNDNNEVIATLNQTGVAPLADGGEEYQVAGETTNEYVEGSELRFRFRFAHSGGTSETILFSYIVAGGTVTGAESIELDGNVIVRGNEIIAPEGSAIYTITGIQVPAEGLAPGVYVVVYGDQAIKVMVK